MTLWYSIIGIILLTLGRKLFWMFIGIIGFFIGFEFVTEYMVVDSTVIVLLVGLLAGIIGTVLAIILERLAFALAGFYAGAFLILTIFRPFLYGDVNMVLVIIGGIIAAALAWMFMDWVIIILSSMVGAGMILSGFTISPVLYFIIFSIISTIGISIQWWLTSPQRRRRDIIRS